ARCSCAGRMAAPGSWRVSVPRRGACMRALAVASGPRRPSGLRDSWPRRTARVPLGTGLAPDLRDGTARRRQLVHAQVARAKPGGDGLGKVVRRRDGMDHLVPAELVEGPVDAGRSRLGGIAPAPAAAHDAPAYLR